MRVMMSAGTVLALAGALVASPARAADRSRVFEDYAAVLSDKFGCTLKLTPRSKSVEYFTEDASCEGLKSLDISSANSEEDVEKLTIPHLKGFQKFPTSSGVEVYVEEPERLFNTAIIPPDRAQATVEVSAIHNVMLDLRENAGVLDRKAEEIISLCGRDLKRAFIRQSKSNPNRFLIYLDYKTPGYEWAELENGRVISREARIGPDNAYAALDKLARPLPTATAERSDQPRSVEAIMHDAEKSIDAIYGRK